MVFGISYHFRPSQLWEGIKNRSGSLYNTCSDTYNGMRDRVGSVYSERVPHITIGSRDPLHVLEENPLESVSEKCFQSERIFERIRLEEGSSEETRENTDQEKTAFTRRLFAYYAARTLCETVCHIQVNSQKYEQVVDAASGEDEKDFWQVFKEEFWDRLTLTQKVKAAAAYYLLGDITKNFIEDLANNFVKFFRKKYSSKEGIENLFINILGKANGFLGAFEQSATDFVNARSTHNPHRNEEVTSTFVRLLDKRLSKGHFINAIRSGAANNGTLTPNTLIVKVIELLLDKFLPRLRIKDAMWKNLKWDFRTNKEKILWAIPYIAFVILNIPLLIIAYLIEDFVNDSIKAALKGSIRTFNPFKNMFTCISDLFHEVTENGWSEDQRKLFIGFISDRLDALQNGQNGQISRTHLNSDIRRAIQEFVPALLKDIHLNSVRGDHNQMKDILDAEPMGNIEWIFDIVNRSVNSSTRLSLERSTEEGLLVLFAALTKKDAIENILQWGIKLLNDYSTKEPVSASHIVDEHRLYVHIQTMTRPIIQQSIQDANGSRPATESNEVERFFKAYSKQLVPHLSKIISNLSNDLTENTIDLETFELALRLLDLHRAEMREEYERSIEMFRDCNIARRQVERKLGPIANEQTEMFRLLVTARELQEELNAMINHKANLDNLNENIDDLEEFASILSQSQAQLAQFDGNIHNFDENTYSLLLEENNRKQQIKEKIISNQNAIHFFNQYITINDPQSNLLTRFSTHVQNFSYSRDSDVLKIIHHIQSQIVTSLPENFRPRVQHLLQSAVNSSLNNPEEFSRKIQNLKDGLMQIKREIQTNSETLRQNFTTHTDTIVHQLNLSSTPLDESIALRKDEIIHNVKASREKLLNMENATNALEGPSVYPINWTRIASVATGALITFAAPYIAPAVVPSLVTTALSAGVAARVIYNDSANDVYQDFSYSRVAPIVERTIQRALQFTSDDYVYRGAAQTGLLILSDELNGNR